MSYRLSRFLAIMGLSFLLVASMAACSKSESSKSNNNSNNAMSATTVNVEQKNADDMFSNRDLDASYDSGEATVVVLSGSYTITDEGTYMFSGKLSDGQIIVDAEDQKVQIVLDGVEISSSNSACIYVKNADKVFVTLVEDSINILTTTGTFIADGDVNVDGVIFSKSDLTLNGSGSLQITSKEGNGIVCKDELVITDGIYDINAAKHAIEANDRIAIADGSFDLTGGKDGIHCDNDDTSLGYIYIQGGEFEICAESDGIDASSTLQIEDGRITVNKCYEGLEAAAILINGGEVNITSTDDGINAAGGKENTLVINGGVIEVNASGDGLDSNGTMEINGGYVFVSGPTDNGNTALDFEYSGIITGGTVIATGSSGMIESFGNDTTQVTMTIGLTSYVEGEFIVKDSSGKEIFAITPAKKYNCIIVSSPDIKVGETYTVTVGGESQQIEVTDTLYSNVQGMGGMGGHGSFGGPGYFGNRDDKGEFPGTNGGEMPEGMERPGGGERPDAMQQPEGGERPDAMQRPDGKQKKDKK